MASPMFASPTKRLVALLRWLEPYTKLDMVYATRGGFWVMLGQVVASLLSLLLVIAFANLLPKETYGLYRYVLSLAGVFNIFALTGMNSAVSRAVAAGEEGALRTSVRYQLRWNLLMLAALLALAGYYGMRGDELFSLSFVLLGLFVPSTLAFNTYGAYLEGKKEFRRASIASILSMLLYTTGMFAAIVYGREFVWLVGAYAITMFVATAASYLYVVRRFKVPRGVESDTRETLRYGRELTFIGFLEPISAQIDKIILTQFWGPAQLAAYSLSLAIPNRAQSFMKSWVGIAFPKFAEKTVQELNIMFYTRILQGIFVGAAAALAYILAAPYVFQYLLPQYIESIWYSQLLSLTLVFAMPNRYVSLLFLSQKMSRRIFFNNTAQILLRIGLYVVLGAWGGILGLVLAHVILSALGLVMNIFAWRLL